MCFRIMFIQVILMVALRTSAQTFVLDGSAVINLSIHQPTGVVTISYYTCHTFPAIDCAEVIDSISSDRKSVRLNVPVRSIQEADLQVGDKHLHLLMVPGDTIGIELTDATRNATVTYNGKTKDVQVYYLHKSQQFPINIAQQMLDACGSTKNLVDFKTKVDGLYIQEQKFWKSAISSTITLEGKKVSSTQTLPSWFIRYENDAMQYRNAQLRMYAIGYKEFITKNKAEIPEGYFDFLKSIPLNNESAMYEQAYKMFLLDYFGFKSGRQPGSYGHQKEFQLAEQALSKKVVDFYKLLSISAWLNSSPSKVVQELDSLILPVGSKHLIDYLRKTAEGRISALATNDIAPNFYLEDKLDSLISLSQFKGEVVYLSFWFAGCKPCVEEFPFENDLVKKFEGKPVKVISICTHTRKAKWQEMIKTHNLQMVNLFANKAWEKKLEENYKVGAYPHYVLIGSDGRVIQNYAKRPREISTEIEKALIK